MTRSSVDPVGTLIDGRDLTTAHPAVRSSILAVTALSLVVVVWVHRSGPALAVALAAVVACYGVLSMVDIAEQRLPNRLTVPLAGSTALALAVGGLLRSDAGAAIGAVAAGLAFSAVLFVLRFGMGDVKLAFTVGAIAAWLGRDAVVATVYAGAVAGAIVALILMVVHRRRVVSFGFGPFLALGSVAGMVVAGL